MGASDEVVSGVKLAKVLHPQVLIQILFGFTECLAARIQASEPVRRRLLDANRVGR